VERVSIHGLDGVARAQASLVCRRSRLHFLDPDGAGQKLRQNAQIGQIEILALGAGRHTQAQGTILPARSTVT
jgi:hypothetical protein